MSNTNDIKSTLLSYINDELLIAKDTYAYASRISDDFVYGVGYEFGFLQALEEFKQYVESIFEGEQK